MTEAMEHGVDRATVDPDRRPATTSHIPLTDDRLELDGLCAEYSKAGVAGLPGSSDRSAKDRRTGLAGHVIEAGIVTLSDIDDASG